jgi:hypothetical protein
VPRKQLLVIIYRFMTLIQRNKLQINKERELTPPVHVHTASTAE